MKLSRKQVKEALQTVPIDQVLGVPGQLTHKQKTFARLVASGETGAGAYRKAYDSQAKSKTQGDNASRLKRDSRIQAEIEAYKLANEAAAYRTPQQLRDLVIHSLTQVIIDPETNAAQRIQAAKVLGTVTEVAAFTERREVTHVKSSADAKAQLMQRLRDLMTSGATDVDAREVSALERELEPSPAVDAAAGAQATPTPQDAVWSPTQAIHTIPHPLSVSESGPSPTPQSLSESEDPHPHLEDDLELELRAGKTPPVDGT